MFQMLVFGLKLIVLGKQRLTAFCCCLECLCSKLDRREEIRLEHGYLLHLTSYYLKTILM